MAGMTYEGSGKPGPDAAAPDSGKPAAQQFAASENADDLTRIQGIGKAVEAKLHNAGIYTYEQLAALNKDERERLDEELDLRGRMEAGSWQEQAIQLAKERGARPPAGAAPTGGIPTPGTASAEQARRAAETPLPRVDPDPPQYPSAPDDTTKDALAAQQVEIDELKAILRRLLDGGGQVPARAAVKEGVVDDGTRPIRHRLNRNRKVSEITGPSDNVPAGSAYQQIGPDGVTRFFGADDLERFMDDAQASDYPVERQHDVTVDNVNLRNWLNGIVEYPKEIVLAAMSQRFNFDGRTVREAKEELHKVINRNR